MPAIALRTRAARIAMLTILGTTLVSAQQRPTPPPASPRPNQQAPTFRSTTDLITTGVVVRDNDGKFVPDLRMDEFQVFEDGVPQKVVAFSSSVGGRIMTDIGPSLGPVSEGLILPPQKQVSDSSGRIFIIFIDDLHLQALDSPQVRKVLGMIRDTIVHDNDLVSLVSTGYSSIEIDPTYDFGHKRFNEAIKKVMGSAMTPQEIIEANQTAEGPAGLRHNTHVAFSTAYDLLGQMEKITTRRKSFIYVSNGYDFNPFKDARYKAMQERYGMDTNNNNGDGNNSGDGSNNNNNNNQTDNPFDQGTHEFAETDLISEVAELVRAARRANTTFYTLDPRGLDAGPSISYNISMNEWRDYVDNSVSTLRVLGDETGGFCVCMTNNFDKYLKQIDNETSDYYMIGYVSNNPDPFKLNRKIEIKITRPGLQKPIYSESYKLPKPKRK
jgi:VWFA-related protein